MEATVIDILNAILSGRLVRAIELCSELEDELIVAYQEEQNFKKEW